jgi:probable F420-dependent oxidoreductase
MTPFFNPGPIANPEIPIYIAGVNPGLCRLAGKLADGLHAHPYHSVRYLREVVLASIEEGARGDGRDPKHVALSVSVMTAESRSDAEFVRSQIAFYASTPSYRPVMAIHGWDNVADRLGDLARRQAWKEMPALIDDEMLETFAVVAPRERLGAALRERYEGLADRVAMYTPFDLSDGSEPWAAVIAAFRGR